MSSRHYDQTSDHLICKELRKAGYKTFDVVWGSRTHGMPGYSIDIYDEPKIHRHFTDVKTATKYIRGGLGIWRG